VVLANLKKELEGSRGGAGEGAGGGA
jgi:hypothetical protein